MFHYGHDTYEHLLYARLCRTFDVSFIASSHPAYEVGAGFIPNLLMRKLRH